MLFADTAGTNDLSSFFTHAWSFNATRFCSGLSAGRSEPELLVNMSFIFPVARRVLTMLSPSPPCGRVSTLIVMLGFLAWNALASALAGVGVCSELSTSHESVTGALPLPLFAPPPSSSLPKPPQAASAPVATNRASHRHVRRNVMPDLLLL